MCGCARYVCVCVCVCACAPHTCVTQKATTSGYSRISDTFNVGCKVLLDSSAPHPPFPTSPPPPPPPRHTTHTHLHEKVLVDSLKVGARRHVAVPDLVQCHDLCVCVCVFVYVYVYVCVCVWLSHTSSNSTDKDKLRYENTYLHAWMHTCIDMDAYMHPCMNIHIQIHTHTQTEIHPHPRARTHTNTNTQTQPHTHILFGATDKYTPSLCFPTLQSTGRACSPTPVV